MSELLTVLAGALLAATFLASFEYYRRLRAAQKEYERARGSVEDIVLSFNRQIKREDERLDLVALKVESAVSRSDRALARSEEVAKEVRTMGARISETPTESTKLLEKIEELSQSLQQVKASNQDLSGKVGNVEERVSRFPTISEAAIEAVIPIKREKAMAKLTETELSALEFLATEGPNTAPEIKDKIGLSREHTARLMKKLYEEGYLERETTKIPFRYSAKEEMKRLLRKTQAEAS